MPHLNGLGRAFPALAISAADSNESGVPNQSMFLPMLSNSARPCWTYFRFTSVIEKLLPCSL